MTVRQPPVKIAFRLYSALVIFVLALVVLGLGACATEDGDALPDGDGVTDGDQESNPDGDTDALDGDVESDGDGESEPAFEIADGALSGDWAMKFAVTYTTVLPILERQVQMVLTGLALLPAEHSGADFAFTETICDFKMEIVEDIDFYVLFPERFYVHIPQMPRMAHIAREAQGWSWKTEEALDLYGADSAQFENPATDPLPIDPDDARLVDLDEDGKPGMTALINGFLPGEVYVIMRFWRDMDGAFVSLHRAEGAIASDVQMVTLGADPSLLNFQLDLQKHDVPQLNRFEMIRLEESLSCEQLKQRQAELFEYDPMDFAKPLN